MKDTKRLLNLIPMENMTLFTEFFILRLVINTCTMVILVRLIHNVNYHRKEFNFTFFLFNFIVFLLAYMLEKTHAFTSLGSAFGLLAAFSLLRFRTDPLSIKDVTYLFIIMTVGLINSVMKGSYVEIVGLNVLIVAVVFVVDGNKLHRNQFIKVIEYPSLDHIRPEDHPKLLQELRQRTGLDITKFTIEQVDFVRSRVTLKVYHY